MLCPSDIIWERYLDGELPSKQHAELEVHLAQCTACTGRTVVLREENKMIAAALASFPVPSDLMIVIGRRLASAKDRGAYWLWYFLPLLVFTSGLVALGTAWLPMIVQLRDTLSLLVGGDLLVRACLMVARLTVALAGDSMRGSPLLPSLTLLTISLLLMKFKLLKGGRTYV